MTNSKEDKSLEQWLWDAACSIRGAKDAPKFKDYILPLVFTKRLCDVYDDEIDRIAKEVGGRAKAFKLVKRDKKLVRFYIPLEPTNTEDPVWSLIRGLAGQIGQRLTDYLREIAKENPHLAGIVDRVDFNATTHGQRDISDDRLSALVEQISLKRLGLNDVEPDIIGRSYEYLIRKFAEGGGQSAGEFYTPKEVGMVIARIVNPEPGMEIYDPCCGSGGLLIKCELVLHEKMDLRSKKSFAPLKMFGQEYTPNTWAMANMNMIIHDMEGQIEIGDTFNDPKFIKSNRLRRFDRIVGNPMWNQDWFSEKDYDKDELGRFAAGYPGSIADWGWMQIVLASMSDGAKAAIVLGLGSATRGSNDEKSDPERIVREYFVANDFVEAVILLPHNMFYNTDAPGLIYVLNKGKENQRKGKILFINASNGFKKGKPKNMLTIEAADAIVESYSNFSELEGFSRIVSANEIVAQRGNLRSSRYVFARVAPDGSPFPEVMETHRAVFKDIAALAADLERSTAMALGAISEKHRPSDFGLLRQDCEICELQEFFSEVDERAGNRAYPVLSCSKIHGVILQEEKFSHVVASSDVKKYKQLRPNMFVYDPMLLWDGSIGMNRYQETGIVSPAYTTFRAVSPEVELDYLEFILRSKLMIPYYISISDGTNWRRRKANFQDFLALKIPWPAKPLRDAITEALQLKRVSSDIARVSEALGKSLLRQGMIG